MARLVQGAIGDDMPTNTRPNRKSVDDKPRGNQSSPEQPPPPPSKGASDEEAAQREREKRIERFRER
jgi:hypothetical protein